jgi:hypothetical protein
MGQKVNPVGFRTGVMVGWKSRWFASKQEFSNLLIEDHKIRNFIKNHPQRQQYRNAGIDRIEIERTRDEVKVVLHVARPGLIIGKKGQEVDAVVLAIDVGVFVAVVNKDERVPEEHRLKLDFSRLRQYQEAKAAAKKQGKATGKRWAYRAFWLPVGAARNEKGDPIYKEVGKAPNTTNVVLPVALGLPDKAANVDLKRFYVGNDLLAFVNALFEQSSEWRTAWENIKPGTVEGNGEAAAVEERAEKDAEDAVLAATGL